MERAIALWLIYSRPAKYTTFHIETDNKKMVKPFINRAYTEVIEILKWYSVKPK